MAPSDGMHDLSQIQVGLTVPLCCVVLDICYPTEQTHGFLLKVRAIDDSILANSGDHNLDHVDVAIWKKAITLFPQISSVGDVLHLEACNVRQWNGKMTLSVSKATKTHVYSYDEQSKRYRKLRDFSTTQKVCFTDDAIPLRVQQLADWAQGMLGRDLLYSGSAMYNRTVLQLSDAIKSSASLQYFDLVCQIAEVKLRREENKVDLLLRDQTAEETVPLCIHTRSCEYAAMIGFVENAVVKLRKLCLNSYDQAAPDTLVFNKASSLVYYPSFALQFKQTSAAYSPTQAQQNPVPPVLSPQSDPPQPPGGRSHYNLAAYQREAMNAPQDARVSASGGASGAQRVRSVIASVHRALPRSSLADVVKSGTQSLGTVFQVYCQVALIHPSSLNELCRPFEGGFEYYFAIKLCDSTDGLECYVFGNETRELFKGIPAQDFANSPGARQALAQYVEQLTSDDWRPFCVKPFMHDGRMHFQLVGTEFRFESSPARALQ